MRPNLLPAESAEMIFLVQWLAALGAEAMLRLGLLLCSMLICMSPIRISIGRIDLVGSIRLSGFMGFIGFMHLNGFMVSICFNG